MNTSTPPPANDSWTVQNSRDLYHIGEWSNGFFGINEDGQVCVNLPDGADGKAVPLEAIVHGSLERGSALPLLLRFGDILDARITALHESFHNAMRDQNYGGGYRGVYPIKVNQQQQVIEEVTTYGSRYHYGLEAGSKAELMAALAYMRDPEAILICNGYKDEEFITLVLYALRMDIQAILVLERPDELEQILACSQKLGIRPNLGVRIKLTAESSGKWADSSGDGSVFGLTTSQVMDVVEPLRNEQMLDCLKLLHSHQGSQIPSVQDIRDAATEACRIYAGLVAEGAAMGLLDMGGGLAVDYTGNHSETAASRNYSLEEYAADLVDTVKLVCDEAGVAHPDIITESGRAITAFYSVLIFNVLDVNEPARVSELPSLPEHPHSMLASLYDLNERFEEFDLQELTNDAEYFIKKVRSLFVVGNISLRERAAAESCFRHLVARLCETTSSEETRLDARGGCSPQRDIYYGNFSVFQSLPDNWAIDQLFPILPIHRLNERPNRRGLITDITCDCDGAIDRFVVQGKETQALPLHALRDGEEYLIGVFLVGAYQ